MSKVWKTVFDNGRTEIRYIEHQFVNSFGSAGKCDALNCNRSTSKMQKIKNSDKFNDYFYLCEICSAAGNSLIASGQSGNGTARRFEPKICKDVKFGQEIDAEVYCYSTMSHAQQKSLEELRMEDYQSDRKTITSWTENDSTFKCPASKCTAVDQSFAAFVDSFCCKENKRQKEDKEKYNTMIMRAADYSKACEAKQDLENEIIFKEQAAKRARESIEEQQKQLKDAELVIKRLKTDFVELHGEVDAKKRKLEEEMAVVTATPPQQLAIEANSEEAVNSAQKKIAKINNSATVQREQKSIKANQAEPLHDIVDVTVTRNSALLAIKAET